jgi:predicted nuclease with TOPRIM domain
MFFSIHLRLEKMNKELGKLKTKKQAYFNEINKLDKILDNLLDKIENKNTHKSY